MPSTTRKRSSTAKQSESEPKKTTAQKGKTGTSKTRSTDGRKTSAESKKTKSTTTGAKKTTRTTAKTGTSRARGTKAAEKTWTEEISVAGNQLVDKFKELVSEGTVRRVVLKRDGNTLLEVPLAAAVVGGALAVWAAPLLSAVAAIAGAATHVNVEIERTGARPSGRAKSK
jgi:uncharacterized protein DUF4342